MEQLLITDVFPDGYNIFLQTPRDYFIVWTKFHKRNIRI